jgi:hypothetical protein
LIGFRAADTYKFKIKADYEWGEARLQAIEELTGTVSPPFSSGSREFER